MTLTYQIPATAPCPICCPPPCGLVSANVVLTGTGFTNPANAGLNGSFTLTYIPASQTQFRSEWRFGSTAEDFQLHFLSNFWDLVWNVPHDENGATGAPAFWQLLGGSIGQIGVAWISLPFIDRCTPSESFATDPVLFTADRTSAVGRATFDGSNTQSLAW